jgi:hypothetical protein
MAETVAPHFSAAALARGSRSLRTCVAYKIGGPLAGSESSGLDPSIGGHTRTTFSTTSPYTRGAPSWLPAQLHTNSTRISVGVAAKPMPLCGLMS